LEQAEAVVREVLGVVVGAAERDPAADAVAGMERRDRRRVQLELALTAPELVANLLGRPDERHPVALDQTGARVGDRTLRRRLALVPDLRRAPELPAHG